MVGIIQTVGGVVIIFAAFDLFETDKDGKRQYKTFVAKVVAGAALVLLGAGFKYLGV